MRAAQCGVGRRVVQAAWCDDLHCIAGAPCRPRQRVRRVSCLALRTGACHPHTAAVEQLHARHCLTEADTAQGCTLRICII